MQITKNFNLKELTHSQVAVRLNINNTPPNDVVDNLIILCEEILQPLRDFFQMPISISSGYRSYELNNAINGSPNSDHIYGFAADIEIFGISNLELAETISSNFDYTQLILEFHDPNIINSGWVHISYNQDNLKCENLTSFRRDNRIVYERGLKN